MDSPVHMGAIFLGSTIFNVLYWGFAFLRMGTTGLTAQAYGAENDQECSKCFWQATIVALVSGAIIIALQYPILDIALSLLNPTTEVIEDTGIYFLIRVWAAPAALLLYVLNGWFFGMQNARYPLYITILVNVLNLALNLFFVFGLDMRSDGVAYGTLLAQYGGLAFALGLLAYSYQEIIRKVVLAELKKLSAYSRFFSVNSDIFIRSILLNLTFAFFTAKSADTNPTLLAANGILLQLVFLFSYAVDGFAFAAESLVGKFFGAGDPKSLRKVIKHLFAWGCGFGTLFCGVYLLFASPIIRLYTDNELVVQEALIYIPWVVLLIVPSVLAFIWDGVYIGATSSRAMRNNMLLACLGFFFPVFFLLEAHWQNHALWLALCIFMLVRGLGLSFLSKNYIYAT